MSAHRSESGRKLSGLTRKYEGKSKEDMAREREQKSLILDALRQNQAFIEQKWERAKEGQEKVFTIRFEEDLTGGSLTQIQAATVIRRWVFETYGTKLGLEDYHNDQIQFRFAE